MSFAFSNESNTPTQLIPKNLATSAAGCPTSSTASQARTDLASEYWCSGVQGRSFKIQPHRPGIVLALSGQGLGDVGKSVKLFFNISHLKVVLLARIPRMARFLCCCNRDPGGDRSRRPYWKFNRSFQYPGLRLQCATDTICIFSTERR